MNWFNKLIHHFTNKDIDKNSSQIIINNVQAINIAIALKHSGKFAMIPENLDIDDHVLKYPLCNYNFYLASDGKIKAKGSDIIYDKDRLLYVIGLLSLIPARNKDNIFEDDYVPINSKLIRNKIAKDYKNYLDYLLETKILECDDKYILDKKSYGYRFTSDYSESELKFVPYAGHKDKELQPIPAKVMNEDGEKGNPLLEYDYLRYWYDQKGLNIDIKSALEFAKNYTKKKIDLGYETWKKSKSENNKRVHPKTQLRSITYNLYSLFAHDYNAKIDSKVHRLHSVITNMESIYRNFLYYNDKKTITLEELASEQDKQRLVNIDIKNSQPFLATLLFNKDFWDKNSKQFNFSNLPSNIQDLLNEPINNNGIKTPLCSILGDYVEMIDKKELDLYIEKVSKGKFYEYIIDLLKTKLNTSIERNNVKTMMFEVLFSQNKYLNQPQFKHKKMFSQVHPTIYKAFSLIKQIEHSTLACLLQSIESEIILHRCCKRIWEEGNHKIPIFSIHDSIVTTEQHLNFVKQVMEEEIKKCIGVSPTLDADYWAPSVALKKI